MRLPFLTVRGGRLELDWLLAQLLAGKLQSIGIRPCLVDMDRLDRNRRVALHFTPTVEIFFGITTRQAIRRGTHRSVRVLDAAIGNFIDGWNDRCKPFVCGQKPQTTSASTPAQVREPLHATLKTQIPSP